MKRTIACLVALVLLCIVFVWNLTPTADSLPGGAFNSKVGYDHSAMDDPIVFPGQPGASHLHDFFGAVGVDAFTQPQDLVGGPTLSENPGATAAYWVPALFVDGVKIQPLGASAIYAVSGRDPATIQPFPFGLVVVAGGPGLHNVIDWACSPHGNVYQINEDFLPCISGDVTVARVSFPDCWDGVHLDSVDHRSHMAYSRRDICPADHPVPMPQLRLRIMYDLPAGTVTLASGPTNTWHADFMNSWDPQVLQDLVVTCFQQRVNCGRV